MTITEADLIAALRELNTELNPSPEPGEFTRVQYAAVNGMSRDRARCVLEKGVIDGIVTKRVIHRMVYYKDAR